MKLFLPLNRRPQQRAAIKLLLKVGQTCRIRYYLWVLTGALLLLPGLLQAQFTEMTTAGLPGVSNSSVAWGDYDDDGDLDILLSGYSYNDGIITKIYRNSNGSFAEAVSLPGVYDGSVAWGDYDNDGDLDILLSGATEDQRGGLITKVFRNDNDSFAEAASLPGVYDGAAVWGDYDNDGDLDILLSGSTGKEYILKVYGNNKSSFIEMTTAGLPSTSIRSVAWGDYDNDGDLDILHIGYNTSGYQLTRVYRNDNGSFVEAARLPVVYNASLAWGDYDNDGDLDILISGEGTLIYSSKVYRNDNGSFVEDASLRGIILSSLAWGDYDNDGDLDILISGEGTLIYYSSNVYRNDNGSFVEDASLRGIILSSLAWGDYDNDGDLDILISGSETGQKFTTYVYRFDNGRLAAIVTSLPGVIYGSVAWGDYDNDGDLDFLLSGMTDDNRFITKIYRNNTHTRNTAPTVPTNLRAVLTQQQVTLSWDAATDAQTPAAGLSYNVYAGTSPGNLQLVSPQANLQTGYRHIPAMGNAQSGNSFLLKALPTGTYYWSVQAVDAAFAGSSFALETSFVVPLPIVITRQPENIAVCEGEKATFRVEASGTDLAYQWYKNGTLIPGATGSTYAIEAVSPGDAAAYSVVVTGEYSSSTSQSASLTLYAKPVITLPTSGEACVSSPLAVSSSSIPESITWKQGTTVVKTAVANYGANGQTVAGGKGYGGSANQLYHPAGVVVDGDGNLYVSDTYNHRIQKWAPGATQGVTVPGSNGLSFPAGVALDGGGNVYVADSWNHRVQMLAPGATQGVTVAGGNGLGDGTNQLRYPSGVAVDGSGNVYVADASNHRIQKWAPGATQGVTVAGGNGMGDAANQLNDPEGVVVDGSGNVYVADSRNHRIQMWAPGATEGVTIAGGNGRGSGANQLSFARGVALDGSGNVYVADASNHRIQKWAPGATQGVTIAGGNGMGSRANQFLGAQGVALDGSSNIYVADEGNHRIQQFSLAIDARYTPTEAGSYTATVSYFGGCSVASVPVTVTDLPAITTQPQATTTCLGQAVGFSVAATGADLSYQWVKNGVDIPGATNSTYSIAAASTEDAAAYSVRVSNRCGTVTSAVAALTLNAKPSITLPILAAVDSEAGNCGATVAFSATVVGSASEVSYKIGESTITSPHFFSVGTTTVTVTATTACGTATNSFEVTVKDKTAPEVLVQNTILYLNNAGLASLALADIKVSSTDNCGSIGSEELSKTTFTCADLGENTVTLTVTDASGNVTEKSANVTIIDGLKPAVITRNLTFALSPAGTVTISAADVDNGSSDNCGIQTLLLDKTTFTCADLGENTVTLTVTDASGHVSSAKATVTISGSVSAPTVTAIPTSNVYTGGNPNVVYIGYGPQNVRLQASGGVSYSWNPAFGLSSTNIVDPVFTPANAGTYTFTVTVTNSFGCKATNSITITVKDVRSGKNNDKVLICHKGKKLDALSINPASVQEHLAHGDVLGVCSATLPAKISTQRAVAVDVAPQANLSNYPNPFSSQTTLTFTFEQDQDYTITIYDMSGKLVSQLPSGRAKAGQPMEVNWQTGNTPRGMYLVRLSTAKAVQHLKLVIE